MLHSWKIGDIKVSSLVEYCGPTHDPKLVFGAMDRAAHLAVGAVSSQFGASDLV